MAALHLEVEPQAVLGCIAVLPHADVIAQPIVSRPDGINVAAFKVAAEGDRAW